MVEAFITYLNAEHEQKHAELHILNKMLEGENDRNHKRCIEAFSVADDMKDRWQGQLCELRDLQELLSIEKAEDRVKYLEIKISQLNEEHKNMENKADSRAWEITLWTEVLIKAKEQTQELTAKDTKIMELEQALAAERAKNKRLEDGKNTEAMKKCAELAELLAIGA